MKVAFFFGGKKTKHPSHFPRFFFDRGGQPGCKGGSSYQCSKPSFSRVSLTWLAGKSPNVQWKIHEIYIDRNCCGCVFGCVDSTLSL